MYKKLFESIPTVTYKVGTTIRNNILHQKDLLNSIYFKVRNFCGLKISWFHG